MNSAQQQQFINDMLVESYEGLDRFDRELLALEKGQGGADTMHSIFRIIHTLKGTSGCLGLKKIQRVAHAGESLLDLIRNDKLSASSEIVSTLLALSDKLREMLQCIEAAGNEGEGDYEQLIATLQRLQTPPQEPPASGAAASTPAGFGLFDEEPAPTTAPAAQPLSVPEVPDAPVPAQPAAVPAASVSEHKAAAVSASQTGQAQPSAMDSAIRVDLSLLDRLMNLVGELVLARNQIVQNTTGTGDGAMNAAAQRLNIITTELQEGVMKTRMQPIGSIWAKYPRIVRDVSQELGKSVRLEMEGQETELDRTIIEAIKDPLTHIIRNSIDHGVEAPDRRRAHGKTPEGLLHLRAFHEGGQVNIEVIDDGAGIDVEKVKAKALQRGAITEAQAERMSAREAMNLIFLPGLSTAEKVTNVSGRGVGMDVVKTNIEKIGGNVDIQSSLGEGTTLRIKIPLTLAIIPALIITSCGERFAIPQVSLVELVRLDAEREDKGIERIFDAPVFRLRGKLLPIVYLNQVLRLSKGRAQEPGASGSLLVLKAGEKQFGLVVDAVNDTQEIVVKPLGRHLKGLPVFAGATIMGDGCVALILDVFGLAQHAKVVSGANEAQQSDGASPVASAKSGDRAARQSLLIFSLGAEHRLALPLSSVGRLERFSSGIVEREGPREVVQYRGQIMPLVRLSEVLGLPCPQAASDGQLPVVVYRSGERNLGLVVGEIEDVIEESIALQNENQRSGILGSAVIQGRVTEMLDIPAIVGAAHY